MSEQEIQHGATAEDEVTGAPRTMARRFGRKRMLAVAGLASATLAFGGLTACDGDSPTSSGGGGSDSDSDDGDDGDEEDDEPGEARDLKMGDTAEWASGLTVTLDNPEPFTLGDHLQDYEGFAYKFQVTVENTSDEDVNGDPIFSARAGEDGVAANTISMDSGNDLLLDLPSTLRAGDTATGTLGVEFPEDAETLSIEVNPMDFESESAFWDLEVSEL